jgi:hypothetical protein
LEQTLVAQGTPADLARALDELPKAMQYRMTLQPVSTGAESTTLETAIARLKSRDPREKAALRERILSAIPPPMPLPPGKTLEDVVMGQWPGDESDEVVFAALEKLS